MRVLGDHYLAGSQRLHDLDALEPWVQASGATALRLEGCTAAANEALLAPVAYDVRRYWESVAP